jgi:cysteinyl-tRNA synthetase
VYDHAHVGHARCYIVYDILVRHLRASGAPVIYARNITDVDDKILKRAAESGEAPGDVARKFTESFHEDMTRLGNLPPDREPRVTEHIPEIIAMIEALIARGAAYPSDGDVYFDVAANSRYGALSHRSLEELLVGGSDRLGEQAGEKKRNPADFALWKGATTGLRWDSPWGEGRPGWHIECSAMSLQGLGYPIDLHGGGLDLVFPHHENELAISESAVGPPFVRHWMHNGFVEVDQQKMSKSLGNFFTVRGLMTRFEPEALRYAVMTVHYRSPMSLECRPELDGQEPGFPQLEEAEHRLEYLYRTRARLGGMGRGRLDGSRSAGELPGAVLQQELIEALDDDLNTPRALVAVGSFLTKVNELGDALNRGGKAHPDVVGSLEDGFRTIGARLGLGLQEGTSLPDRVRARRARAAGLTPEEVEQKIRQRSDARLHRDYARADAIRRELGDKGVELLDSSAGTDWRLR